uniref:Uncharacterized protein n=1 Tax=Rhizophora mucronata TaxID=61149 RepID=A0A2P2PNI6_RHIMU
MHLILVLDILPSFWQIHFFS